MLVLTRKIGEEIIIDGTIRVTITAIHGNKVRIGINAPSDVRINRAEVHSRIMQFAAPDASEASREALTVGVH